MAALLKTAFTARVTWLGRVADSGADLQSEPLADAMLTFEGIEGECHGGLTRPSCSRVMHLYPRGTEIRNVRQLSVLSEEEIAAIGGAMGVEELAPAWLGASIVVEGLADFTRLPPSSRLQAPSGAVLVIDMENRPCVLPGRVIEREVPGKGKAFKRAAEGLRGVTAWVEREGRIALGDWLTLFVPDQPAWPHLEAARAGRTA